MSAAVALTVPQRAHAGDLPVVPNALAQAGLAAAQNAVDAAAVAVSNANPAIAVPTISGVAPAATPAAPTRAAAAPAAAPVRTAPRPTVVTTGAAARAPRHSAPPAPSARAADPALPVPVSAAHAGAVSAPAVSRADSAPVLSVPRVPVVPASVGVVPVTPAPVAPVPPAPVAPAPSLFVQPAGAAAVPTVPVPDVLSSWPEGWPKAWAGEWALLASAGDDAPVPAPVLGTPTSTGWPLDLAALPLSGAPPSPSGLAEAGVPLAHGARPGSAPPPRRRHLASGDRRGRAGHPHPGSRTRSAARGLRSVPAASWTRPAVHSLGAPATAAHAPSPPRLRDDDGAGPRPAHPEGSPSSPVPPLSAPATGGGAAAAAGGSGGGGASLALLTTAALLLIFTLSTRVSLDLSAWRSTLLGLRLERPG